MLAFPSHGVGTVADLNHYFSRADNPLSLTGSQESTGVDYCASDRSEPLPRKSASEKEQDRIEHCFEHVDHIRAKLKKRGLLEEKGNGAVNVLPDAGEKLRDCFASALTAITSIGGKSGAVKPKDIACGLIFGCCTGMVVAGAMAFAFNKVVSALATVFPSYKPYFDNAGKLVYYLLSAEHALINGIQSVIHEAVAGESNEIVFATLVSIEILLGIYATSVALESNLADRRKKSEMLSTLLNSKEKAKRFFDRTKAGENITPGDADAEAYDKFMGAMSRISEHGQFGSRIASIVAVKESLWLNGSIVGNQAVYGKLMSSAAATSVPELIGTALAETALSCIANPLDIAHGVFVHSKSEDKEAEATRRKEAVHKLAVDQTSGLMAALKKGLSRLLDQKVQDEKFEQGFSKLRIVKAIGLIAIGVVSAVALFIALPYISIAAIAAGAILAIFFTALAVRMMRSINCALTDKQEKEACDRKIKEDGGVPGEGSFAGNNKYYLLHVLANYIVRMAEEDGKSEYTEIESLLAELGVTRSGMEILKNLSRSGADKSAKLRIVEEHLARTLEIKMTFG